MVAPVRRAGVVCLALVALVLTAAPASAADPHAALIGKPAPDFKADFTLGGKATTVADLKGKVVMLDFWAVWCGPCIQTFPALKDLQSKYNKKGLEIVGVTTYYERIGFDKAAGKTTRLATAMSKDEEQTMLKDFIGHHKLEHRIVALTKADWGKFSEAFKVEGIPQMVLIDKKGNVRLVLVGSGEDNEKELEMTVKKLLAE